MEKVYFGEEENRKLALLPRTPGPPDPPSQADHCSQ